MSADNDVDVAAVLGHDPIRWMVKVSTLIAKMRKEYYDIAMFDILELCSYIVNCRNGRDGFHAFYGFRGADAGKSSSRSADYADLEATPIDDHIRLNQILQHRAREIPIGAYYREFRQSLDSARKFGDAVIELVIPQCGDIRAKQVHQLDFKVAMPHRKIWSSLAEVACIEYKDAFRTILFEL